MHPLVGLRRAVGASAPEEQRKQKEQDSVPQESLPGGAVAVDGTVSVVAHFFGLLVTFIGGGLTLRMLRTVWPDFAPSGLTSEEAAEGENEKDGKNERP